VSQYDFAHVAMPNEPPSLFLSYGVRDASEIAERLHRDLAARGYQVWQDVSRLRTGRPWDEDVSEGLRTSQVVLALLSPHSVRHALDTGNPTATDSVCLDEIAYARGARKIPIVPVQVISCETPFLIYRLHQIDFRDWRESEATYQAGLSQICAGIEAALLGETPERPWRPLLDPWDFAPFLLEKRNHFTGRQWLFRDLDEWRRKEAPPALLITGEPGIGKSAIVAALVHENPEGQVLAYHCCRADTPATLEPARFVRSLAGMLAARLEEYATMLENPGIRDALERADTDPASAFEAAVLSPLHNVPKTAGDRRYLLIDALDEALMHPKRPTIVEVLAARINRLPPWLGIVATTRNEPGVMSQLRGLLAQALEADDPKNQDDVLAFLQRRLSESGLRHKTSDKTLDDVALDVLRSSAGNFLFATTAIDAIEAGQLRLDDVESQPPGRLSSLYEVFFNRLFRDAGMDFQSAGQVLEVVAAERDPLSRKQIAAVIGLDAEKELPSLLGRLAAFLLVREERYSLFHRSLFEWLTGWDIEQDQSFAGLYHLSLQEGYKRLTDWCWAEYALGVQNASLYCLRHLVVHLHEADRNDQVRTVLLDFDWLQAKLEASDVNGLIADYDYLPEDKDLKVVQSAIRLSAHVLVRDPRQLAQQLIGRLLGNKTPSVQVLLKTAAGGKAYPWFLPLSPSLTVPGGSLIRTLEGHKGVVTAVAVTPDGRRAVSTSNDRTVRVWDLETGQTIRTFRAHTDAANAMAIMPDGCRAVSASTDNTLRIWDLKTGQRIRALEGHTRPVRAVTVTSDGHRALSASGDQTLRLWDLETGQTIRTLEGHTGPVWAVAVTANGHHAISGSYDRTLRFWDLESGQTIRMLEGHTDGVNTVTLTSDGCRAVSASTDDSELCTLRLWDLGTGKTIRTFQEPGFVRDMAITPDGRHAIWISDDHALRLWDLESGQSLRALEVQDMKLFCDMVRSVAVTPNGRRAVSGSSDGRLRVWDLDCLPKSISEKGTGSRPWLGVLFRKSLSALDSGQTIRTLEGHTFEVIAVAVTPEVRAVAVTPDGHHAVLVSKDRTLRLWELGTGQTIRTFRSHAGLVNALAVTPDGCRAVSASDDGTLRLWDLSSGRTIRTLRTLKGDSLMIRELQEKNRSIHRPKPVKAAAVTPDGRHAISVSWLGEVRLWDLRWGPTIRMLEATVNAVAITPDSRHAVLASDNALLLWDLEAVLKLQFGEPDNSQTLRALQGHTGDVNAVAVTRDGRRVVSASSDATLRLWDLGTGQTLRTLQGHTDKVNAVAVRADGRRAVSGSSDATLRLWDLETGENIATFIGDGPMLNCAVTSDGRTIIAGDDSGRAHYLRLVEADEKQSLRSANIAHPGPHSPENDKELRTTKN
jgi:WD40 repeat protein